MIEVILTTLLVVAYVLLIMLCFWGMVRILHKAGFSGYWVLLMLIPIINIIFIWIFAFASWPILEKHEKS